MLPDTAGWVEGSRPEVPEREDLTFWPGMACGLLSWLRRR